MGPLAGIRIIDLTSMLSGPWATMILGDQGADVIKVEMPGQGDHTRTGGNRSNGMAASFLNQPIEVPTLRDRLRGLPGGDACPQLLLRVGYAPTGDRPASRRPVVDVLSRASSGAVSASATARRARR